MSMESECPNCGAEYDIRNGNCPACTVNVEMRSAHPPYKTWSEPGHIPFEMHGEQFAVTRIPCALDSAIRWRVSHVNTGVAMPNTASETRPEAREKGIQTLTEIGAEKFKAALSKLREKIACG